MSEPAEAVRITRQMVRDWRACYHDNEIDACFGDCESLTLLDVMQLDIELGDRIWVVQRALPAPALSEIACRVAELALPRFESRWPQTDLARKVIELQRSRMRGDVAEQDVNTIGAALVAFMEAERATGTYHTHPAMLAGFAALGVGVVAGVTLLDVYLDARASTRNAARSAAAASGCLHTAQTIAVRDSLVAFEAAVQQIIRKFIVPETKHE